MSYPASHQGMNRLAGTGSCDAFTYQILSVTKHAMLEDHGKAVVVIFAGHTCIMLSLEQLSGVTTTKNILFNHIDLNTLLKMLKPPKAYLLNKSLIHTSVPVHLECGLCVYFCVCVCACVCCMCVSLFLCVPASKHVCEGDISPRQRPACSKVLWSTSG